MNKLQFKMDYGLGWWYLIDVTVLDGEIDCLDIYECYEYEGKEKRQLLLGEHPLYHDEEIKEMAEDRVLRWRYYE